jgi:hypothetical protein
MKYCLIGILNFELCTLFCKFILLKYVYSVMFHFSLGQASLIPETLAITASLQSFPLFVTNLSGIALTKSR